MAGLAYTLPFSPSFVVIDGDNAVMDGSAPLESADGGTVQVREDAVLALRTYDLEVTVTPNPAVTWHTNGGTPEPTQTSVAPGGSIAAPAGMTKQNAVFAGWFTDKDLTKPAVFPLENITADTELWAKWEIAWNDNAGDLPTLVDGDVITIATGASGTLSVPENATVTIVGGTNTSPVDNNNNGIDFYIPATSKVVWKAYYESSSLASSAVTIADTSTDRKSVV